MLAGTEKPYNYVGEYGYYSHTSGQGLDELMMVGSKMYNPDLGLFTQHGSPYGYAGNSPVTSFSIGDIVTILPFPGLKNSNPDEVDAVIKELGYTKALCAFRARIQASREVSDHYSGDPNEDVWGDTLANAVMHCTLTCTIAQKCGNKAAKVVTNNHEKYNWNKYSGPMDLANNAQGLNCSDWAPEECESSDRNHSSECLKCCGRLREKGELSLLPKVPVPSFPGGN